MRRRFSLTPISLLFLVSAWACDAHESGSGVGSRPSVDVVRGDTMSGSELAAIFGCGACHVGAPPPVPARDLAAPLNGLSRRWEIADLAAYLVDPRPLRDGVLARMPDFHLDTAEATAVARHLLRDGRPRRTRHPGATAERGAAIVDALNCAGCHQGTGTEAWSPGPPLQSIRDRVRPDWLRGYLAAPTAIRPFGYYPGSGSRMPAFDLSPAEADSLADWVAGGAPVVAAAEEEVEGESERATSSDVRAKRLLEDHLACLGCHALDGAGGRIAPALDGAGARLRPEYLRRMVHTPARAVPGTVMPAPLEDSATIGRVVTYLRRQAQPGGSSYLSLVDHRPARPRLSPGRSPSALYASYCAACHGPTGEGDGFNAAYLPLLPTTHADSAHMSTRPDDTLFDGIHGGGHILGRSHRMPAFGGTLTTAEIRGLVAHLRELCRCAQPDWAEAP